MRSHCLCGNITIELENINSFETIDCSMCRRWSRTPFMAIHSTAKPDIQGQDPITVYLSSP